MFKIATTEGTKQEIKALKEELNVHIDLNSYGLPDIFSISKEKNRVGINILPKTESNNDILESIKSVEELIDRLYRYKFDLLKNYIKIVESHNKEYL